MDEQKLISTLASINVWWNNQNVPPRIKKADTKRKVFFDLANNCLEDLENISCISGPRQVGKTTLMGQLMDFQLNEKNIDPKRIIYIPIDNEAILLDSDNILMDSLKVYFDYVLEEPPQNLSKPVYVYLDEIQSLENWAKKLKSYLDIYDNLKFIISGSSHTKLYQDSAESLVGRIHFRLVLPFKFREFLDYNMEKKSDALEYSAVELREALKKSLKEKNPETLYKKIIKLKMKIAPEIPRIKKILEMYLIKGGYPGALAFGEDYDKSSEKIKTDLELTVYKDIHKLFKTRNSSDLMSLLVLIASSSGQKINYLKLSSVIGIDRRVVADYLSYTNLLYLTSESPIFKASKYKQAKKQNKVYIVDVGHRNVLLGKMNKEILSGPEAGLIIQTAVFNHASRLRYYLTNHTEHEVNYWEDGNNHEVDLIMDLPIFVLPMEVKSKSGDKGKASVFKFIEEHKKSKWGMIINNNELKLEKNILFIPLWAFLLMC